MSLRARVVRSFPPRVRAYAAIRYGIIRGRILAAVDARLPPSGAILELGCGYGLFAAYLAARGDGRRILGVDRDAPRIAAANAMAARVSVPARFEVTDVRSLGATQRFAAIYAIDVLHHVPAEFHATILRTLRDLLEPGGALVLKEIDTRPRFKLWFTRALDRVMAPDDTLSYRPVEEWAALVADTGFEVETQTLPDLLPFPHVVIAGRLR